MKEILESLNLQIKKLKEILPKEEFLKTQKLYFSGNCQVLTYGKDRWEVLVGSPEGEDEEWLISYDENDWYCSQKKIQKDWTPESAASLFQIREDLQKTEPKVHEEGKTYSREGMIKRVMAERREKAEKADYRIVFADNIYGEHKLTNEKGITYKITLRDFKNETGYIDNPDLKTNKLGTTKHLIMLSTP